MLTAILWAPHLAFSSSRQRARNIFDSATWHLAFKRLPFAPPPRIASCSTASRTTPPAPSKSPSPTSAPVTAPRITPTPPRGNARHLIERSAAIACPSVLTQLAGMKKVQQVLATPESVSSSPSALRRFAPDDGRFQALWKTFTNIYPLDGATPAGREARRLATHPEECKRYVLKPQREGGGNNFYRGAIPERLREIPEEHWGSYILMELITPPPVANTILRNGKLEQGGVICELGVYGDVSVGPREWESVA
ncbi:Glutathione synthetase [Madurella mycetomatis]|uniref:glutathione synthase n=1 Tax=Madurella mycetomatis TaxID=100816 RepID=A0A175VVC6_9PEZI|nr:Glutathione synthetase [Madurella mycetomatis]